MSTTNIYVSSVAWAAVAAWAPTTAYTVGQYVRQLATPSYGLERVFKCTTAGTTGASEPTWSLNNNATTTSGTAVFTQVAGQEAEQAAGNWKAPLATITAAIAIFQFSPNLVIFLSSDHTETSTSALTLGSGEVHWTVLSVSRTGASLPPTATDDHAGATISTSGASDLRIGGALFRGITFQAGSGSSACWLNLGFGAGAQSYLENCTLSLTNTSASSAITIGSNISAPSAAKLNNVVMNFGAVGQSILHQNYARLEWYGKNSGLSGTVPTNLISWSVGGSINIRGVDLSTLNTTLMTGTITSQMEMVDCKLHASLVVPTRDVNDTTCWFRMSNCDDATSGTNYRVQQTFIWGGMQSTPKAAVQSGASDGVTSYSHLYTLGAHSGNAATVGYNLVGPWYERRNNTVGSSKTLTMEAAVFSSSAPTNATLWMEAEALTTAGVPVAEAFSTRVTWPLDTPVALTTSTAAWDGGAGVRQNSHTYVIGDLISAPTNAGRLFVCIFGGTTASSEPGAYATAVDGGAVTDGTAHFQAAYRVKLQVTFTPRVKGCLRARLCATGGAAQFCVDPKLYIT